MAVSKFRVSRVSSFFLSSALLVFPTSLFAATLTSAEFEKQVNQVWDKYVADTNRLVPERKQEFDARALKFQDKTMKFTADKIGQPDANGYPLYIALHGGGGAPAYVNDSQWQHMSIYYKDSVKNGVYVAPRGVTDTWNLHFVDESYPLYDRLIEDMVMYEGVDPNRVYLLGFSAGGDGVYQVVPRMADRFAAANMSAGHHNWINFDNLYNTPFVIQVGENDSMYNRNKVAAENYLTLKKLNKQYNGGYTTDVFVHANFYHNGWPDNNPARPMATVLANPEGWLNSGDRATKTANTNGIDWVNNYTRNPLPSKVVWDLGTRAPRTDSTGRAMLNASGQTNMKLANPSDLFYWLDVSVADKSPTEGKLVVELDKANNMVNVLEATGVDKFRVLLNVHMLDLSKPVVVKVGNQVVNQLTVKENDATLVRTMLERSDKNFAFDAEFMLVNQPDGSWVTAVSAE